MVCHTRVTPFIGLAYYDGADDGVYHGHNLATGNYPTLFANGNEYGNYIAANPIVLADQLFTHELIIYSESDHCPVENVTIGVNYNLDAIRFDVINNSTIQPVSYYAGAAVVPPTPPATPQESDLLRDFGKVFYYQVEVGTSLHSFGLGTYLIFALEADPEIDNINPPYNEWEMIPDASNPGFPFKDMFGGDLWFHYENGNSSFDEIIVDSETSPSPVSKLSGESFFTSWPLDASIFYTGAYHPWGGSGTIPFDNVYLRFY